MKEYYNKLTLRSEQLYFLMKSIRVFEEKLLLLYGQGHINGTIHTYMGQEANAAAIVSQLDTEDGVFSNHRCHGHFLVNTLNYFGLLAEILGKEGAVCKGRGGSQHIHQGNFYSNGVQGSIVPNAAGFALSQKMKHNNNLTVVFIGDGTLGQGSVYETMNMCSLWGIPLLIVCENNGIAQTTKTELNIAGQVIDRAAAFSIDYKTTTSTDCEIIYNEAKDILKRVRDFQKPFFWEIKTVRLGPHSKGDDTRDPEYILSLKSKDPLTIIKSRLNDTSSIDSYINNRIDEISEDVLNSKYVKI